MANWEFERGTRSKGDARDLKRVTIKDAGDMKKRKPRDHGKNWESKRSCRGHGEGE